MEKKPDAPRNQQKHLEMGMYVGWVAGLIIWALNRVPNSFAYLWILALVAWFMFIINFERNQCAAAVEASRKKHKAGLIDKPITARDYWRAKWLDSILDVLAGLIGFALAMLP